MKVAVFDNDYTIINSIVGRFKPTGTLSLEFDLNYDSSFLETSFQLKEGQKKAIDFKNHIEDYDAVIINMEASFFKDSLEYEKVVEIIFRLRIKYNFGKPIILMGFQNLLSVLKQIPKATVLNAYHVYFVDLLSDLTSIENILTKTIDLDKKQIRDEYLDHAKNYFDLTSIRHEEANWFCIKTLYDYYNQINNESIPYPKKLENKLNELNYVLASFIYLKKELKIVNYKSGEVTSNVDKLIKTKLNLEEEKKRKEELINDGVLESLDKWCKNYNIPIDQIAQINFNNLIEETPLIKSDFDAANRNQKIAERSLLRFDNRISELEETIRNLGIQDVNVLLIDDLANDGFYEIYKKILKDQNLVNCEIRRNKQNDNFTEALDSLKDHCTRYIVEQAIDIILLDLNLFPKNDENKSLENKSGIKLLKFIKTEYPWIPVIITSASNKIWTINKISQLKADAYWIKEGLDNNWSSNESHTNYKKLIELVKSTKNIEFKALKTLYEILKYVEITENQWWKSGNWRNGEQRESNSKLIKDCLLKTINQLTRHCKDFVMNFNYVEENEASKISLASIFNNIGIITEAVLNIDMENFNQNKSLYLKKTPNYQLDEIKELRNKASHISFLDIYTSSENLVILCDLLKEFITSPIDYSNKEELESEGLIFEHSYIATFVGVNTDEDPNILNIQLILPQDNNEYKGNIYLPNSLTTFNFGKNKTIVVTPTYQKEFFMLSNGYYKKLKRDQNFNCEPIYFKIKEGEKNANDKYYVFDLDNNRRQGVLFNRGNSDFDSVLVGYIKNNFVIRL